MGSGDHSGFSPLSPPSQQALIVGKSFVGVGISLNIVGFFFFVARIWTRSIPHFRLSWDDYLISVAWIATVVDSGLLLGTVPFMFGQDPASITLRGVEHSFKLAVFSQPVWAWSMAMIKCSVATMLLRLQQERSWQRFLWVMIVLQVLVAVYNMLAQLLQCIPLHAAWDLTGVEKAKAICWSSEAVRISSICVSSFNIVTDIIFALTPISFLRKVNRPFRERFIIGILMALGVFAALASIFKVIAASKLGRTSDPTYEGINIGMWSLIEELTGVIAACIPCLKSPFQRVLETLGIISTNRPTEYHSSYGRVYADGPMSPGKVTGGKSSSGGSQGSHLGTVIRLGNMRSTDSQSVENILTEDPAKDGEIWVQTEVRMQQETRQSIDSRDDRIPEEVWPHGDGRDGDGDSGRRVPLPDKVYLHDRSRNQDFGKDIV